MHFYKKKNNPNLKTFFGWRGGGVGGCRVSEFYRESKSKKNNNRGGGGGGRGGGVGGFGGGG